MLSEQSIDRHRLLPSFPLPFCCLLNSLDQFSFCFFFLHTFCVCYASSGTRLISPLRQAKKRLTSKVETTIRWQIDWRGAATSSGLGWKIEDWVTPLTNSKDFWALSQRRTCLSWHLMHFACVNCEFVIFWAIWDNKNKTKSCENWKLFQVVDERIQRIVKNIIVVLLQESRSSQFSSRLCNSSAESAHWTDNDIDWSVMSWTFFCWLWVLNEIHQSCRSFDESFTSF